MGGEVSFFLIVGVILFFLVIKGVKIVPQQQAWILEKLGKFDRTLEPGLRFIIPFVENISYRHSLKEQAVDINEQTAITKDNVSLRLDGVLYLRIVDPISASYGVTDPFFAITQLAQTTMRSEIGKMSLDKTFEERDMMNANIVQSINEASQNWGIQCMRYEIKDINPPATVLKAMELQVAAERQKRAAILESEGKRQAQINISEADKREVVLNSEGIMTDQINRAKGESEAILLVANANAKAIELVSTAIEKKGGTKAVSMKVAEQYIDAFANVAKTNNTLILPANAGDIANMTAQALTVFSSLTGGVKKAATKDSKGTKSESDSNPWGDS